MLYKRIGRRIRGAREILKLSQEGLGRLVGYSPTAISYFESGLRKVKIEDLQKIAQVLGKPIDFFLQQEPEDEIVAILWRAQQELPPTACRQMEEFLNYLETEGVQSRLTMELSGFRPYAAAHQLIKTQGVQEPPVSVKEVAHGVGIPVMGWQFGDEVSAVLVSSQRFIAMGVNESHPESRRRFSIAHELGHAVLGHAERLYIEFASLELLPEKGPQHERDEHEANWFAADLLMPKTWVEEDWQRFKDVSKMAERYGVSEQAMWIRLQQFNLTQPGEREA